MAPGMAGHLEDKFLDGMLCTSLVEGRSKFFFIEACVSIDIWLIPPSITLALLVSLSVREV